TPPRLLTISKIPPEPPPPPKTPLTTLLAAARPTPDAAPLKMDIPTLLPTVAPPLFPLRLGLVFLRFAPKPIFVT
ncbi:unnamed protein product, partial [Rotaria magnacalcarata]